MVKKDIRNIFKVHYLGEIAKNRVMSIFEVRKVGLYMKPNIKKIMKGLKTLILIVILIIDTKVYPIDYIEDSSKSLIQCTLETDAENDTYHNITVTQHTFILLMKTKNGLLTKYLVKYLIVHYLLVCRQSIWLL